MRDDAAARFHCTSKASSEGATGEGTTPCSFQAFVREVTNSLHEPAKNSMLPTAAQKALDILQYLPPIIAKACEVTMTQMCSDDWKLLDMAWRRTNRAANARFSVLLTQYITEKLCNNVSRGLRLATGLPYVGVAAKSLKLIPVAGAPMSAAVSGAASALLTRLETYWTRHEPAFQLLISQALLPEIDKIVEKLDPENQATNTTFKTGVTCKSPLAFEIRSLLRPTGRPIFKTPTEVLNALSRGEVVNNADGGVELRIHPSASNRSVSLRAPKTLVIPLYRIENAASSDAVKITEKGEVSLSSEVNISVHNQYYFRNDSEQLNMTLFSTIAEISRSVMAGTHNEVTFDVASVPNRNGKWYLTFRSPLSTATRKVIVTEEPAGVASTRVTLRSPRLKKEKIRFSMDGNVVSAVGSEDTSHGMQVGDIITKVSCHTIVYTGKNKITEHDMKDEDVKGFLNSTKCKGSHVSFEFLRPAADGYEFILKGRKITKSPNYKKSTMLSRDDVLVFDFSASGGPRLRIRNVYETESQEFEIVGASYVVS